MYVMARRRECRGGGGTPARAAEMSAIAYAYRPGIMLWQHGARRPATLGIIVFLAVAS